MLAHKGTDAVATLDIAVLGQVRQRPADRDARDPELVAQRLLGGQRVAGRQHPAVDLVVQHQVELAVQRNPGRGRYRPGLAAGLAHAGHVFTSPRLHSPSSCYMYITTSDFEGDPMTAVQQQTATDPAGPTGQLAGWVAGLTLDEVPPAVVERA